MKSLHNFTVESGVRRTPDSTGRTKTMDTMGEQTLEAVLAFIARRSIGRSRG
jgi:hypothetical protein